MPQGTRPASHGTLTSWQIAGPSFNGTDPSPRRRGQLPRRRLSSWQMEDQMPRGRRRPAQRDLMATGLPSVAPWRQGVSFPWEPQLPHCSRRSAFLRRDAMRTRDFQLAIAVLLVVTAGCKAREPEGQQPNASTTPAPVTAPPVTTTTTTPPPPATAAPPPAATPAPQAGTASPAAAAPAGALASQQTNWPGIVADVTEFRRKGSTLTARVVLRNQAGADAEPDIHYGEVYVMDAAAGKKYEPLKDEKGTYIAALRSDYSDRW